MTKRVPDQNRCQECFINKHWCICSYMKKYNNHRSEVSIVMHHREQKLTSNTARMLDNCLVNSKIYLRGLPQTNLSKEFELKKDHVPLYLYPDKEAITLDKQLVNNLGNQKIQLIVPDGTWSQTQKFKKRESFLKNIQSVKLNGEYRSIYGLRRQHRQEGVCTMEAAAYALGVIEGEDFKNQLMSTFKEIIHQLQKSRSPNSYANTFSKNEG